MSLGSSGWKLKSKHRSQRLKFPKWTLEANSKGYSIPADSHVKMLKFAYALSWCNKSTADPTTRSCFPAYFTVAVLTILGCSFPDHRQILHQPQHTLRTQCYLRRTAWWADAAPVRWLLLQLCLTWLLPNAFGIYMSFSLLWQQHMG